MMGLCEKFEFYMYMSLSPFLGLKNLVLNFLKFLNNQTLLSYKPRSYIKAYSLCCKGSLLKLRACYKRLSWVHKG